MLISLEDLLGWQWGTFHQHFQQLCHNDGGVCRIHGYDGLQIQWCHPQSHQQQIRQQWLPWRQWFQQWSRLSLRPSQWMKSGQRGRLISHNAFCDGWMCLPWFFQQQSDYYEIETKESRNFKLTLTLWKSSEQQGTNGGFFVVIGFIYANLRHQTPYLLTPPPPFMVGTFRQIHRENIS